MFVRIVKLSFHQKHIPPLLSIFEEKKKFISASKGGTLLALYQDKNNPDIVFTYSYWVKALDLENYRNADLFKDLWAKTNLFFNDKPFAWSAAKKVTLK